MVRDSLSLQLARRVAPQVLLDHVSRLGWQRVEGINGNIVVFHRPGSPARQVLIPVDVELDDYGDAVAEAVRKLAEYENRPSRNVLVELLVATADAANGRGEVHGEVSAAVQQELIRALAEVWALAPDVRLGQLMAFLGELSEAHGGHGLWDIEDDKLLAMIDLHKDDLLRRDLAPSSNTQSQS